MGRPTKLFMGGVHAHRPSEHGVGGGVAPSEEINRMQRHAFNLGLSVGGLRTL